MSNLHEGIQLLFEAADRYLEGASSVHELNGITSSCLQLARREQASHKVIELLEEWLKMINRRWNVWGLEKIALSEPEFQGWLREQLPFTQ